MCRYLAYLGKDPIVLGKLVLEPVNSLLYQSMRASETPTVVNGDGYGLGWYVPEIRSEPAVYRSISPAWNDRNLKSLAKSTASSCFIAHVRSATIASVDYNNCHPFSRENLLFAHNGSVEDFLSVKKAFIQDVSEESWKYIGGQTDSEYVFALLADRLKKGGAEGFFQAFQAVKERLLEISQERVCHLNIVVTDGKEMMATRFTIGEEEPLSLYVSEDTEAGTLIASESLAAPLTTWRAIPANHAVLVDASFNYVLVQI